jgi:hypothetical protein
VFLIEVAGGLKKELGTQNPGLLNGILSSLSTPSYDLEGLLAFTQPNLDPTNLAKTIPIQLEDRINIDVKVDRSLRRDVKLSVETEAVNGHAMRPIGAFEPKQRSSPACRKP